MAEEITTVLEEEQLETDQSVVTDEATDEVLKSDSTEETSAEAVDDLSGVDTEKGYKKKQFPPKGGDGDEGGNGDKPPKCGPNQVYDEKSEKCVASKETEELSVLASYLAEETAKGISAQLTPVFESFTESLKVMGTGMEAMAAKMVVAEEIETETETETEPEAEAKPEAEPEPETVEAVKEADPMQSIASVLTNLQSQLVETQKQVEDVAKTAEAISQSTPDPIDREETVKSAEVESQPNDCFDNIWPFLGQ